MPEGVPENKTFLPEVLRRSARWWAAFARPALAERRGGVPGPTQQARIEESVAKL